MLTLSPPELQRATDHALALLNLMGDPKARKEAAKTLSDLKAESERVAGLRDENRRLREANATRAAELTSKEGELERREGKLERGQAKLTEDRETLKADQRQLDDDRLEFDARVQRKDAEIKEAEDSIAIATGDLDQRGLALQQVEEETAALRAEYETKMAQLKYIIGPEAT